MPVIGTTLLRMKCAQADGERSEGRRSPRGGRRNLGSRRDARLQANQEVLPSGGRGKESWQQRSQIEPPSDATADTHRLGFRPALLTGRQRRADHNRPGRDARRSVQRRVNQHMDDQERRDDEPEAHYPGSPEWDWQVILLGCPRVVKSCFRRGKQSRGARLGWPGGKSFPTGRAYCSSSISAPSDSSPGRTKR